MLEATGLSCLHTMPRELPKVIADKSPSQKVRSLLSVHRGNKVRFVNFTLEKWREQHKSQIYKNATKKKNKCSLFLYFMPVPVQFGLEGDHVISSEHASVPPAFYHIYDLI